MTCFTETEEQKSAKGGTELALRNLARFIPQELQEHFQVISSRVREIDESKIRIYWIHDMPEDPEISHLKDVSSRNRFHKIIWNSNWQFNDALSKLKFPRDNKHEIIELGIDPIPYKKKSKDHINIIYHSTPHRGLEILIPVFTELAKKHNNIHLTVVSSFKIYNREVMDKKYEPLYEQIKQHPQMTYIDYAKPEVITELLQNSHIFAYPSIWQETGCRCLMESMSAGLMCVHPNLAALSDTSGQLTLSYQYQDDLNTHASLFHHYLEHAINSVKDEATQNYLGSFVKTYADLRFGSSGAVKKWEMLMRHLLSEYPTIDKRQNQKEVFVYRT